MNVGGYFFGFLGSAMGAGGERGTGTGAASHSGLSGSEQSGRTGQQGQGAAGRGYPASTGVPYEDSEGPDSPSGDPYELLYGITPENKSPDPVPGSQVPVPLLNAGLSPNQASAPLTHSADGSLEGTESSQEPVDDPYVVAKTGDADPKMVSDALKKLIDNSPKFRKLFEQLSTGQYNYRYKYNVSNADRSPSGGQFARGLAGESKGTERNDRGADALITIYMKHPELNILPPKLKEKFLLDLISHETIHALLANNPKTKVPVDHTPDTTGKGGDPNTHTLLDWMNNRYPVSAVTDANQRKILGDYRKENYGNLDIGEKSQQYIKDIMEELEKAGKLP